VQAYDGALADADDELAFLAHASTHVPLVPGAGTGGEGAPDELDDTAREEAEMVDAQEIRQRLREVVEGKRVGPSSRERCGRGR
jgi:hypothetical protein